MSDEASLREILKQGRGGGEGGRILGNDVPCELSLISDDRTSYGFSGAVKPMFRKFNAHDETLLFALIEDARRCTYRGTVMV